MSEITEGIFRGAVVHTRLTPVHHTLRYSVVSLLFDCDRLDTLNTRLRLFSFNRINLVALHERDHGDGTALRPYLDRIAAGAGMDGQIARFMMLCHPRILGYAFNPITVYYGLDGDERIRLTIYEVNNTFGERQTYVLPAEPDENGLVWQSCPKAMFVSPFNAATGTYSFHLTPPAESLTVGVALKDADGPKLKAWFRAERSDLTDATLLRALAATGWMTVKVIAGIHIEAARLWLKGMRPHRRPKHVRNLVTYLPAARHRA